MQTFLPYESFEETALCLDPKRLGNQVYREGKTLVNGGWPNHPASKMWQGHYRCLCEYCAVLASAISNPATSSKWFDYFMELKFQFPQTGPPKWLGNPAFHAAHRSNLLRKDPLWYSQFGWTEPDDLPYIWPI